ncbi:MAG: type restriction enzyme [Chloroflexota bacterium]|nr:type restriction enzyme [Chloroflexota bacterium]
MIRLRDYQEQAIRDLLEKSNRLERSTGNKTLVFKAPTGSGKTIMMAEYLSRLNERGLNGKPLAFIWTAPRKLHTQSKEKLENYYRNSRTLKPVEFDELNDRQINTGEILFFNWESINKEDNIYIRENEQEFNLSIVLLRTRDTGHEIVLVIDEAHHSANTDNSLGLIEMIDPKLCINVSATPTLEGDEKVNVYREDVIEEGIIKKQVVINPGFKNLFNKKYKGEWKFSTDAGVSTDEQILAIAVTKRQELQNLYIQKGININPLLLIQIPDSHRDMLIDYREEIERMLAKNHNITIENGKLAIYLSENKENLANLTHNDNEVEVMLFKQAIALGWDCPRASILCLFRDWKSYTFSLQTLGRILRMPELKHYDNEDLDSAFVYTTTGDLSILEDAAGDYITIQYSHRKDIYRSLKLRSVHGKRQRELTRLSPAFNQCFITAAKELGLNKTLDLEKREVLKDLVTDGKIESIDQDIIHLRDGGDRDGYQGDVVQIRMDKQEIQHEFDQFAAVHIQPEFYPEPESVARVKESIYTFFSFYFPGNFKKYDSDIQKIVLDLHNQQHVINVINRAKEIYTATLKQTGKSLEVKEDWEIPEGHSYNVNYTRKIYKKAIMEPAFESLNAPDGEIEFASYLDENEKIEWWFKNGDRLEKFLAVPYIFNDDELPFYVDWIVLFRDGRLGLFDTKAGFTEKIPETKAKAEGLQKYIEEENNKGKNIVGGIVKEVDSSWRINDNKIYSFDDIEAWKYLDNL